MTMFFSSFRTKKKETVLRCNKVIIFKSLAPCRLGLICVKNTLYEYRKVENKEVKFRKQNFLKEIISLPLKKKLFLGCLQQCGDKPS